MATNSLESLPSTASLPSNNGDAPSCLKHLSKSLQQLYVEMWTRMNVQEVRSKCAICPGGRLTRKGNEWVRDAYEACEFSRVPSEKHVAEVVRTFAQQYHLCDERVNLSRWASEEASKLCDVFKRVGATARVSRCKANKRKAAEPTMDNQETLVMEDPPEEHDDGSDHLSEHDGASGPDDIASDAHEPSEDLGSADEDDEATFRKRFEAFDSEQVECILQSIKSHELFPFFEAFQSGSAECHSDASLFGTLPVEDVLAWNAWLEEHGAAAKAKLSVLSGPAEVKAADEAAGAPEGASPAKDDDEQGVDGSDGSDAPAGDHDGSEGSGESEDQFAFLEDLVAHARSLNVDDDSRAPGSSKRRLDFTDDDDDDGRDVKKEGPEGGPEFVPSSFKVSGLPAADINKVQKAALESVNHPILTPQEQLDLIKNERAKKAATAPKKGPAKKITKECISVYSSGWMKEAKIRPTGKCAGNGYFVYWAPSGTLYTIRTKAEKDGFQDDDDAITRVVDGEEAENLKKERKALMYKARSAKIQQSRLARKSKKATPPPPVAEESEGSKESDSDSDGAS